MHNKITVEIEIKYAKGRFLQTILISSLSSTSVAMVAQITSDDTDHNKKQYLFA